MTEEKLQKALATLHTWAQENAWTIVTEKEIQTGHQVLVTDGATQVPVNCFTNGNIQVQGAPSPLKDALQAKVEQWRKGPAPPSLWGDAPT
ncbi:MAG: hypothetical protein JO202_17975 [Ktedonobacteraceae bacterium]|nr:hypothetical protein [Ktedonobacteraceae bacterium]